MRTLQTLQPKLDAVRASLEYKRSVRAELEKTIANDKESASAIAKESADIARRALQRGRSLFKREASNRLEFHRGYSTKVNTSDILRGQKPVTTVVGTEKK